MRDIELIKGFIEDEELSLEEREGWREILREIENTELKQTEDK